MRKSIDHVNEIGVSPSAEDVVEAIHRTMHGVRAGQYRVARGAGHDLSHMDGKVLGFFARHPGATQKDLALHSGRDKGQLARLIAGLKERGLLDAAPDEADRRNIRLQLTAEGRAMQKALRVQARRVAEQAVAGLDAGERRQLLALLDKVRVRLEGTDG